MRVLILGGYGLIGAELARTLRSEGHELTLLGRSAREAYRVFPDADWIIADLADLTTPDYWTPHIGGVDAIVNAAGALQEGPSDRLSIVHDVSISALVAACERAGVLRFVQISAPGAHAGASTAFLRTKAAGDRALRDSTLDWAILRPGVVIARNAYGGTALLRMLASIPFVQPIMLAERRLHTVSIDDVADAVRRALAGEIPPRSDFDLVEADSHSLAETVRAFRTWLGVRPARLTLAPPRWLGFAVGRLADLAGWLGWRSPLRTTALRAIDEGVCGDPAPWRALIGHDVAALEQTLASMPATAQERVAARMQVASPFIILTLAGFWIVSGVIGFAGEEAAVQVVTGAIDEQAARMMVRLGGAADIALGVGALIRATARWACLGMALLTLAYLIGSIFAAPALWLDPLGPMLKAIPAAMLALVGAALLDRR